MRLCAGLILGTVNNYRERLFWRIPSVLFFPPEALVHCRRTLFYQGIIDRQEEERVKRPPTYYAQPVILAAKDILYKIVFTKK